MVTFLTWLFNIMGAFALVIIAYILIGFTIKSIIRFSKFIFGKLVDKSHK